MAVRRNEIPRSLIGAGGVKLFDIPGVIYPPEMLAHAPKPEEDPPCELLTRPPLWGMTTAEVARQLGCTVGAARMRLQRCGVERAKVRNNKGIIRSYWRREQVRKLLSHPTEQVEAMPSCYLTATAAAHLLQISRSTLSRYEKHGKLKSVRVMFCTGEYKCVKSYYLRSEVRRLNYHLNAIRSLPQ